MAWLMCGWQCSNSSMPEMDGGVGGGDTFYLPPKLLLLSFASSKQHGCLPLHLCLHLSSPLSSRLVVVAFLLREAGGTRHV